LFGAHLSVFYERRFNDIFAIEGGAVGGENFIRGISRLAHAGAFFGPNLYLNKIDARHQFYFSPSLAFTYGKAKFSNQDVRALALMGSAYFIYRYLFSFGLGIEAGLGTDAITVLFPLSHGRPIRPFFFPTPKIELGLSYAF